MLQQWLHALLLLKGLHFLLERGRTEEEDRGQLSPAAAAHHDPPWLSM